MKREFRQTLSERMDIPAETLGELPLTQIRGRRSVNIENHRGILAYTDSCVKVAVKSGAVSVHGSALAIIRMTRREVEIRGRIAGLELE